MYPINEKEILELKRLCTLHKTSWEKMCKSYTLHDHGTFKHTKNEISNRVDLILVLIEEWEKKGEIQ